MGNLRYNHLMGRMTFKQFIKNELSGWKTWEIAWFLTAFGLVLTVSLILKNSLLSIFTATTGVANVVLVGKGKLGAYIFGIVNTVLYSIISFQAKYYGVSLLNIAYYLPMQFYGLHVWGRHMNASTNEVEKRVMSRKAKVVLGICVLAGTTGCGFMLKAFGDALPFVDALSTILSIIALYISIKMYAEQWVLWIGVNSVNSVLWAVNYLNGGQNISMFLMYIVFLTNAIIMYRKWMVEAKGRVHDGNG